MDDTVKVWVDCTPSEEALDYLKNMPDSIRLLGISYSNGDGALNKQFEQFSVPVVEGFLFPMREIASSAAETLSPVIPMNDVLKNVESFWIVAMGPLTNIAALLRCQPKLKEKVKGILLLGGGAYKGDVLPSVEKNFCTDPEAASIVFQSGYPLYLIPYEMRENPLSVLSNLDSYTWENAFVEVDLWGAKTRGASVIDFNSKITGRKPNSFVLTHGNGDSVLRHGHI